MENVRLLDTPEQQAEWIREVLCRQTEALAGAGFTDIAFMVIGQGIETMGAFLDKKPFRAPGQSHERFDKALAELFPPRYAELNGRGFLYRNLRSSLTHLSVGSPEKKAGICRSRTKKPFWCSRICYRTIPPPGKRSSRALPTGRCV